MNELTLQRIFAGDEGRLPKKWRKQLERQEGLAAVRRKIKDGRIPGLWESTRDEVFRKTEELLKISLLDVAPRAWAQARELARYRDPERYPPEKSSIVPLAEHKIRSRHQPHLEIRINEQPAGRISFEIQIRLALKGLRLHIQAGRIKRIDTGECRVEGSLSCEGHLLARQASRRLELPGSLDLGEGIEI
jgi:hypothetical protein